MCGGEPYRVLRVPGPGPSPQPGPHGRGPQARGRCGCSWSPGNAPSPAAPREPTSPPAKDSGRNVGLVASALRIFANGGAGGRVPDSPSVREPAGPGSRPEPKERRALCARSRAQPCPSPALPRGLGGLLRVCFLQERSAASLKGAAASHLGSSGAWRRPLVGWCSPPPSFGRQAWSSGARRVPEGPRRLGDSPRRSQPELFHCLPLSEALLASRASLPAAPGPPRKAGLWGQYPLPSTSPALPTAPGRETNSSRTSFHLILVMSPFCGRGKERISATRRRRGLESKPRASAGLQLFSEGGTSAQRAALGAFSDS